MGRRVVAIVASKKRSILNEFISAWEEEAAFRFGEDQTLVPKVPGKSLAKVELIIKSRLGWERGRVGAGLAAMILQCNGANRKEVSRDLLLCPISFAANAL